MPRQKRILQHCHNDSHTSDCHSDSDIHIQAIFLIAVTSLLERQDKIFDEALSKGPRTFLVRQDFQFSTRGCSHQIISADTQLSMETRGCASVAPGGAQFENLHHCRKTNSAQACRCAEVKTTLLWDLAPMSCNRPDPKSGSLGAGTRVQLTF